MGAMRHVIAVSSGLTGMGQIAVTFVDRVAWARTSVRGTGATLNDISSFTLSLPLPQSLSSFSFPLLLAVSIAEFSFVVTFRLHVVAVVRGGSHSLVIVDLV